MKKLYFLDTGEVSRRIISFVRQLTFIDKLLNSNRDNDCKYICFLYYCLNLLQEKRKMLPTFPLK
jgi:hypothetical protein